MPRGNTKGGWRNYTTATKQKAARDAEIKSSDNRMAIIQEFAKLTDAELIKIAQNDPNKLRRSIAAKKLGWYA